MRKLLGAVLLGAVAIPGATVPALAGTSRDTDVCPIDHHDPGSTIYALTTPGVCTQAQIDALYGTLDVGPMPEYGAKARGYWRWSPNFAGPQEAIPDRIMAALWQGGTFFVPRGSDHGIKVNRVFADEPAFAGQVYYGRGYYDGGQAVIVDYSAQAKAECDSGAYFDCAQSKFAALWFRDECRQAMRGVWLCFAWKPVGGDADNAVASDAMWWWSTAQASDRRSCLSSVNGATRPCDQNRFTWVVDFLHPEIPFEACPHCTLVHELPGAGSAGGGRDD